MPTKIREEPIRGTSQPLAEASAHLVLESFREKDEVHWAVTCSTTQVQGFDVPEWKTSGSDQRQHQLVAPQLLSRQAVVGTRKQLLEEGNHRRH